MSTENSHLLSNHLFHKYGVLSNPELYELHQQNLLVGSIVFTSDSRHVGIHKLFYGFLVCRKKILQQSIDPNICHAMIVIGWNDKNHKPKLAHSVMDGLKINSVDYFKPINYCGRPYNTADKLIIYSALDPNLRKEIASNAEISASISSQKSNRSKFSWSHMTSSLFKSQYYKFQSVNSDLIHILTDLLLERKLSPIRNELKTRSLFCTEYVVYMVQASILFMHLNKSELLSMAKSRSDLANILSKKLNNGDDDLYQIYHKNPICHKIKAENTVSPYFASVLDEL